MSRDGHIGYILNIVIHWATSEKWLPSDKPVLPVYSEDNREYSQLSLKLSS